MKATPEQMGHLGEILCRLEMARIDSRLSGEPSLADPVLAGFVTAVAILLPPRQWEHFRLQAELDPERLSALAALVPKARTESNILVTLEPA